MAELKLKDRDARLIRYAHVIYKVYHMMNEVESGNISGYEVKDFIINTLGGDYYETLKALEGGLKDAT